MQWWFKQTNYIIVTIAVIMQVFKCVLPIYLWEAWWKVQNCFSLLRCAAQHCEPRLDGLRQRHVAQKVGSANHVLQPGESGGMARLKLLQGFVCISIWQLPDLKSCRTYYTKRIKPSAYSTRKPCQALDTVDICDWQHISSNHETTKWHYCCWDTRR